MLIPPKFRTEYEVYLSTYLPAVITGGPRYASGVNAILDEVSTLATDEVCAARRTGLALTCETSDLRERLLRLDDGSEVVAGIRFKNLDVAFPFVEIHKAGVLTPKMIDQLRDVLPKMFSAFDLKGFMFKDRPAVHATLDRWSHTVFGELAAVADAPTVAGLDFAFTPSLDWHPQYVSEYEDRLNEKPELRGFVRIGQLGEFAEAADADALMIVEDADGFAGVVAATPSPLYGLDAAYVIESFLSRHWVGRGLAAVAHRSFFNGLASDYRYVWGTIYVSNVSSLKTAQRTGRTIIETEYFVPFAR